MTFHTIQGPGRALFMMYPGMHLAADKLASGYHISETETWNKFVVYDGAAG